jgi:hypothetical protein
VAEPSIFDLGVMALGIIMILFLISCAVVWWFQVALGKEKIDRVEQAALFASPFVIAIIYGLGWTVSWLLGVSNG